MLESYRLYLRHCGVNCLAGEEGEYHAGYQEVVSSYGFHCGEELSLVIKRSKLPLLTLPLLRQKFLEAINLAEDQE